MSQHRRTGPRAAIPAALSWSALWLVTGCLTADRPGLNVISEGDIRRDITVLAGDGMRGREAGTLDELRASAWIAEQAKVAGLEPAGDDGTYFQFWPLRRTRLSESSAIRIGGSSLEPWTDVIVLAPTTIQLAGRLVFVGDAAGERLTAVGVRGRVVAATVAPPPGGEGSLRAVFVALGSRVRELGQLGATAVILVGDSVVERRFDWLAHRMQRGTYTVDGLEGSAFGFPLPVLLARSKHAKTISSASRVDMTLAAESFIFPSVNVIAKVAGTGGTLADEYVLFSGHQDHDGIMAPESGDSIYNGADDNASASVALLAIGRAFARAPARRSALFVWHGAEEKGLFGSRWHASHPVVPRESIIAVLNADMIGRNHPDTAALLGSQPPHRNSQALVAIALAANQDVTRFVIDSTWDRPDHPEGFYFRSDHLPYARVGIPALFFTSMLHPDYHTPRDAPGGIDAAKLTRVARWMYATGWTAANADERPALDSQPIESEGPER